MRLAIINNTSKGTSGGHIKYLKNIIENIGSNKEIKSALILSPIFYPLDTNNFNKIILKSFKPLNIVKGTHPSKKLKFHIKEFKPDLIFIPNERYLYFKNIPTIIMVRNMEPLVKISDNPINELIINKLKRLITLNSCKKSNHIIAVSDYVKETLIKKINIEEQKISRVYHGGTEALNDEILKKINIGVKSFLFTAGSIRPARGLEDIIIALGILKRKQSKIPHLVIAGECINMGFYKKKLNRMIEKYKIKENIVWLGKISQEKMGWCYKNSIATILSSRVESFCFVAHEAMSYGSIIISSNSECLPEILGNTAIYYKSLDPTDLSHKIATVFNNIKKPSNSKQAILRAMSFSSKRNFQETLEVFKKVHSQNQ
jgi:glycosyltransferase involved in cell wall biosynthesis